MCTMYANTHTHRAAARKMHKQQENAHKNNKVSANLCVLLHAA